MPDRKRLIVGNWKMNATHLEAIQMFQKLSYRLDVKDFDRVEVVVAPPFTSLRSVQTVIEADRLWLRWGRRTCTGRRREPSQERCGRRCWPSSRCVM